MAKREIHTIENLRSDLRLLGVKPSADLIVHASLRSIGNIEGGYRNLLQALLLAVGSNGTIIAPAFYYGALDPASHSPHLKSDELRKARAKAKPYDIYLTPSGEGALGDIVRLDPRSNRCSHPVFSWAVIGARSAEFTSNITIDDADGLESTIGRIYSRGKGQILLLGVDHTSNTSIHLAESLAKCRHYFEEVIRYKTADLNWDTFSGCGGCSRGFYKIRGMIDFTKFEIKGKIGNALSYLIEQKPFVDAAKVALEKKPWGLLCDKVECLSCNRARILYGLPPLEEKEYHLRHPWAQKEK